MASKAKSKAKVAAAPAPKGKVAAAPPVKFQYQCPACTKVAIKTSNRMLGVDVVCAECGKQIKLDNKDNYSKIK